MTEGKQLDLEKYRQCWIEWGGPLVWMVTQKCQGPTQGRRGGMMFIPWRAPACNTYAVTVSDNVLELCLLKTIAV